MNEDNKVISFGQPDVIDDRLRSLLRVGARRLLEPRLRLKLSAFSPR